MTKTFSLKDYRCSGFTTVNVVTQEPERLYRESLTAGAGAVLAWDAYRGFREFMLVDDKIHVHGEQGGPTVDIIDALTAAAQRMGAVVFIDRYTQFADNPVVPNALASVSDTLRANGTLLAFPVPDASAGVQSAPTIEHTRPDTAALADLISRRAEENSIEIESYQVNAAAFALQGLTLAQADDSLALCLRKHRGILDTQTLVRLKGNLIRQSGVLRMYDQDPTPVAGHNRARTWIARAIASGKSRSVMLAGVPGTGKTTLARLFAQNAGIPFLTMDMAALRGKFQGETETRLRETFSTIRAFGRAVVFIDEADKALAGSESSQVDGGTGQRILGPLLQEIECEGTGTYWIFTANRLKEIYSMSGGALQSRVDATFAFEMPAVEESRQIARIHCARHGIDDAWTNTYTFDGYVGRDIEKLCRVMSIQDTTDPAACADFVSPLGHANRDSLEAIRRELRDFAAIPTDEPRREQDTRKVKVDR